MRRILAFSLLLATAAPAFSQTGTGVRAPSLVDSDASSLLALVDSVQADPQPLVRTFTRSGFSTEFPATWRGREVVDETRSPYYAAYTFTEARPGDPMNGARLRVERVTNLNPVDQERWRLGQANYGYHDTRPVALRDVDLPNARAFEVSGQGTHGVVVFLRRGQAFYTILATGAEAAWKRDFREIEDMIYAVSFL